MDTNEQRSVTATAITEGAFAPFGDLILARPGERPDYSPGLANLRPAAGVNFTVVSLAPAAVPVAVSEMERHPHSSQTFLPLTAARYLVVVAPDGADGGPDASRITAFTVPAGAGITYRAGVWHTGMACLDAPATFAVLMWRDFGPGDQEFRKLQAPVAVRA
jgi:ureidoglycolate lyase